MIHNYNKFRIVLVAVPKVKLVIFAEFNNYIQLNTFHFICEN